MYIRFIRSNCEYYMNIMKRVFSDKENHINVCLGQKDQIVLMINRVVNLYKNHV